MVVGIAVLVSNAVAAGWGAVGWLRKDARASLIVLAAAARGPGDGRGAGGDRLPPAGPRGLARPTACTWPTASRRCVITLVSEAMRAGVAQRELEDVEDVDALERARAGGAGPARGARRDGRDDGGRAADPDAGAAGLSDAAAEAPPGAIVRMLVGALVVLRARLVGVRMRVGHVAVAVLVLVLGVLVLVRAVRVRVGLAVVGVLVRMRACARARALSCPTSWSLHSSSAKGTLPNRARAVGAAQHGRGRSPPAARGRARASSSASASSSWHGASATIAAGGEDHGALAQLGGQRQVVGGDEHRALDRARAPRAARAGRAGRGWRTARRARAAAGAWRARWRSPRAGARPSRAGTAAARAACSMRTGAERLGHAPLDLGRVEAHVERAEGHVLRDGRHEELVVGVLEDEADARAQLGQRVALHLRARPPRARPCPSAGPLRCSMKRGLAGAVGPEHGDALAVLDVQVDAAQRRAGRSGSGRSSPEAWIAQLMPATPAATRSGTRATSTRPTKTTSARPKTSGASCGMLAVVAAREHREVDALAARVGAQEQRRRHPAERAGVERVARAGSRGRRARRACARPPRRSRTGSGT